jgi:DNA repair exonuclease SbcCD nuclease subunit
MSKVAVITDTHFGARGDSPVLGASMAKFYKNVFFPKLDELGINTVLHGGDYTDRRKYVNFGTARFVHEFYRIPMQQRGIEEVILVGNHDCFLKHTNDINSIEELYRGVEGISLIKEPQEFLVHTTPLLLLPWINDNNRDRSLDLIRTSACEVVLGHLELAGFQMYRGSMAEDGLNPQLFDRFDLVMSGHYHHKSEKGPVHYLGAPYPMIWSDYQDARGFHILDLETRQLEFIENPYSIFYRLVYDDAGRTFNYIEKMVEEIAAPDSPYHEAYIKVVVRQKTQPYWFDLMMDALYRVNALDVVIVDDIVVNDDGTETRTEDDLTTVDTLAVMTDFVDNLTINCDKNQLTLYLRDLYNEALAANQSARLS